MTCVKYRDFTIPATGSLYVTTYDPELAQLFDIGREIVCYRNEFDCAELIRYYLDNPAECEDIGRAGRERCIREHRWVNRLEGLLRWMGILAYNK
jgi:spore maturation protein CgeB